MRVALCSNQRNLTMKSNGLSRPGALLMIVSIVAGLVASIGPIVLAITSPTHNWLLELTGPPVVVLAFTSLAVLVLYVVGFVRYCTSKGYSAWLGAFLLLGHVFGLVVLLLLPDIRELKESSKIETSRTQILVP